MGVLAGKAAQHDGGCTFAVAICGDSDKARFVDSLVGLAGSEYALQEVTRPEIGCYRDVPASRQVARIIYFAGLVLLVAFRAIAA